MQNVSLATFLRAAVLGGLAALFAYSHVFVAVERIRVRVLETPTPAIAGQVRVTTTRFPEADGLTPPFALIARITEPSPNPQSFSMAVDGRPVCVRDISGGSVRRVDCAVKSWSETGSHEVTIQGPQTMWTLEYLELATHHGNTDGAHYLVVLPAGSQRYLRPASGWVMTTWILVGAAILLLPAPPPLPRWGRLLYAIVATLVLLELTASMFSQWISSYRIVFSSGTFAGLLAILFAPQLWAAGSAVVRYVELPLRNPTLRRRVALPGGTLLLLMTAVIGWQRYLALPWEEYQTRRREAQARERLFAELQPVTLANCEFKRFGEPNDGGYVLCANLLSSVQSGYSYGISGYDQWGCEVSRNLGIAVHQYDCFNLQVPACEGGRTVFHAECIAETRSTIEGRSFDTLANQFAKNGDTDRRVVVKMDVEGAEWKSLLQTPERVLQQIDQLAIELHGVRDADQLILVIQKLNQVFYVASIHYNNFACLEGVEPFPSDVYEVLFVNRRLATLDESGSRAGGAPQSLMAPNNPRWKDCQSLADLPPVRD